MGGAGAKSTKSRSIQDCKGKASAVARGDSVLAQPWVLLPRDLRSSP